MPYIGRDLNRGNYLKLDDISSSFNGSTQTFNLTVGGSAFTPGSAFSILVSLGGVIQEPESAYQVNNSEITFANAPTAQDSFFCIALGVALGIGVPSNGTVNGTQIAKPFNYDGFFYLNDGTNRVGINSSIPSETLDIVGNTKISGILTALTYSGPIVNASGISTFYDLRVSNNLTVEGTTTTLDTNLIGVDRIEVGANSNTVVGVAITQSGTADIVNLFDGSTKVLTVKDGGSVGIGTDNPAKDFHVTGTSRFEQLDIVGFTTFGSAGTRFYHHTPRIEMPGNSTATISFVNATTGTSNSDGMLMGFSSSSEVGFINVNESAHGFVLKTGGSGAGNERLRVSGLGTVSMRYGSEEMVNAKPNAGVELYFNGTKRLETTNSGVGISSSLTVSGISTFTGRSDHSSSLQMLAGNNIVLLNDANSANCQIDCYGGAGFRLTSYNQTMFTCENGSTTKFYTDSGTSRLEITNAGDVLVNTGTLHIPDALTHSGDTDTKIRFPAADTISFETAGSERLRIRSDGRVGINTTNPNALLDVYQDGTGTVVDTIITRTSGGGGFAVQCSNIAAANPAWALRTYSAEDLVLSPGGNADVNEKVRIKASDGKVGIGSDAPHRGLVVQSGSGDIHGLNGNAGIYLGTDNSGGFIKNCAIARSGATNYHIAGSTAGDLCIGGEAAKSMIFGLSHSTGAMDQAVAITRLRQFNIYYGSQSIRIHTGNHSNAVERLRITSDGKIGIGQDAPSSMLTIKDETGGQSLLIEGASGNDVVVLGSVNGATNRGELIIKEGTTGDAYVKLSSKASTSNFIMNNNLGIGTDNPLSLLSLGASANPTLEFKDYTNHARAIITGGANGQLVFTTDVGNGVPNSDFIFRADSSTNEIVRFNSSGLVGIGTNNPSQELSIWSDSPAIRLVDTNPYEAGAYGQISQSGSVLQIMADSGNTSAHGSIFFYSVNDNDSFNTYRIADNYHLWYNSGEEKMRLIGGQLGIGTDNPIKSIDVYKTTNDAVIRTRTTTAGAYFDADSAAAGYYGLRLSSSGTDKWFIGSYNSANFQIKDGSGAFGIERFTIQDGTGKVGINSTSPQAKLEVLAQGNTERGIYITDSDNNHNSPYLRVLGKRSDGNTHQSFSGRILLASLRTEAKMNSGRKVGVIMFGGNHTDNSESNILYPASIAAVAGDSYDSATDMPTDLVFYTGVTGRAPNDNNVSSGEERLRIQSGGDLDMATNVRLVSKPNGTWGAGLKVGGNGNASDSTYGSMAVTNGNLHLDARDGSYGVYLNWYGGANGTYFGDGSGSQAGRIDSSGNLSLSGTYPGSDLRLKENIQNISGATDTIKSLVGKTFTWKADAGLDSYKHYGFIAQEVQKVAPDLVKDIGCHYFNEDDKLVTNIDPTESDEDRKNKGITQSLTVNNEGVTPILVEAMKELITKVEILEAKVAALEGS